MAGRETEVSRLDPRDEAHFITPFLSAFPNPIVVHSGLGAGGRPASGTSVCSWYLRGARSADLYAYPPGGSEKFLGTVTKDGSVRSEGIALGQKYKWKIFPRRTKAVPYDEVEVTITESPPLPSGAGPLGHPGKFANVFRPTNLVSRARWYTHEHTSAFAGPTGLFTRGLGPDEDRPPTPDEVLVGYVHVHESTGWFSANYGQYDTYWRGGVQFDPTAVQAYVQRWGMLAATLSFSVGSEDSSCVARVEQAAQDMSDWESVAAGLLPGDEEHFVDLPVGPLKPAHTPLYRIHPGGVFSVNVGGITDRWAAFGDMPYAFALIGADESFPQDENSTFMNHCSNFVLVITPSPFMM
jgi:hypothetical protein